ncbi:efflux transporter periplasmic adaptor subunit, partial [Pelomonas sp. HMWF004]
MALHELQKPLTFSALAALLLLAACQNQKPEPPKGGPPEVGVVRVSTQDAPLEIELPGRLSASQVAEIRPQVGGIVLKRLFTEGALVKAGQPLYQLDAASLEAERARSAAALQKTEATLAVARSKAARDAELLKADAISRQAADDSAGALRQAEADVAVARAALDAARVQLDRARIVAPISGRTEVSTVTAGALVTANQTQVLTTVQQLDPMQVDIVQSSAELLG